MNISPFQRARRRVKAKKNFYRHLSAFLTVGVYLCVINLITDPWNIWFPIPLTFWALGLFFHYLSAIGIPFLGIDNNWEEKEIERELERMQNPPTDFSRQTSPMDEQLELKDFKQLREEWKDQDFV